MRLDDLYQLGSVVSVACPPSNCWFFNEIIAYQVKYFKAIFFSL